MEKKIKKAPELKPETVARIAAKLREKIAYYNGIIKKGTKPAVSISGGNSKIGHVLNVSLAPIITCGAACAVCSHICYDGRSCLQYSAVMDARARNTAIALNDPDYYFGVIRDKISRRKKK